VADEIEGKLNSTFNNQYKFVGKSEPPIKKIQCVLESVDISWNHHIDNFFQEDVYYDTKDRTLLKQKDSLRIRRVNGRLPEVTSKHFVLYNTNGQHTRVEEPDIIKPGDNDLIILHNHAKKYFPDIKISDEPAIKVNTHRVSFIINTQNMQASSYLLCLDKFRFINPHNNTRSDDYYEIEIEKASNRYAEKENDQPNKDLQIEKLILLLGGIFDFLPNKGNKYEKGVKWLDNPIDQKSMQFIEFDIVDYSLKTTSIQKSIVKIFTKMVIDSLHECDLDECIKIPIGDGVILSIDENSDKVIKALQIFFDLLTEHNRILSELRFELRTAVNYGNILFFQDINNNINLAGKGINTTARMISKAEKSQILISDLWFDNYRDMGIIPIALIDSGCFSEPFNIQVKHGANIPVRNFREDSSCMGIQFVPNDTGD
jgi:uncharacterized protein YjbK